MKLTKNRLQIINRFQVKQKVMKKEHEKLENEVLEMNTSTTEINGFVVKDFFTTVLIFNVT